MGTRKRHTSFSQMSRGLVASQRLDESVLWLLPTTFSLFHTDLLSILITSNSLLPTHPLVSSSIFRLMLARLDHISVVSSQMNHCHMVARSRLTRSTNQDSVSLWTRQG